MAIDVGDAVFNLGADVAGLRAGLQTAQGMVGTSMQTMAMKARQTGMAMTAMGGAITGTLGTAVYAAQDFGGAMAEVSTLGIEDLDRMSDAVKDVSTEFGLNLRDAAKGAYQAISAGVSEMDAPDILAESAKAATAGVTNLQTAIELGTSVTNAYGREMSDISITFDQAFVAVREGVTTFEELASALGRATPMFAGANVASEELFASVAALTKGGMDTAMAVTSLNMVLKDIVDPQDAAAKTAESLGIEFNATALASKGLHGVLQDVKQAAGGNIEVMSELFGSQRALLGALALTGGQAEEFTRILGEMENATGMTDAAFELLVENDPGFAFRQLKQEVHVLFVEIGTALLPALHTLLKAVKPIIETIIEWVKENSALIGTVLGVVGAFGLLLTAIGPILILLPGLVTLLGILKGGFVLAAGGAMLLATTGLFLVIPALIGIFGYIIKTRTEMARLRKDEEMNAESLQQLAEANHKYQTELEKRGVALDYVAMQEMEALERNEYLHNKMQEFFAFEQERNRLRDAMNNEWTKVELDRIERELNARIRRDQQEENQMRILLGVKDRMLNEEVGMWEAYDVTVSEIQARSNQEMIDESEKAADSAVDVTQQMVDEMSVLIQQMNQQQQNIPLSTRHSPSILDRMREDADEAVSIYRKMVSQISSTIEGLVSILGQIGGALNLSGSASVSLAGVPQYATGGLARGLAIVGERGPELVNFGGQGGQVFSNAQSEDMLSSSINIDMRGSYIRDPSDIEKISQDLKTHVDHARIRRGL